MTDTTAKIRAKGLDSTGVTEEIANQMYAHRGRHYMAIVEMKVDETHDKADGTHKVDLILTQVEPSTDEELDEHLRELTRTLYYNRGNGEQPTLTGSDERTVGDVLAAGAKHRPHPFLPVDASDDNGICDVCGTIQAAAIHSTQEVLDDEEDPDEDEPELDDTAAETEWVDSQHGDEPEDEDDQEETDAILGDPDTMAALEEAEAETRHLATVPDPFTPA